MIYSTLVLNVNSKPFSQIYFEKDLSKETYKMGQNISKATESFM